MYMDGMFSEMNNIENLDISTFNTSNVINMDGMFASSSITSITYGSNFIHNVEASTSSMFLGCTANKPNGSVHSSWEGIFD